MTNSVVVSSVGIKRVAVFLKWSVNGDTSWSSSLQFELGNSISYKTACASSEDSDSRRDFAMRRKTFWNHGYPQVPAKTLIRLCGCTD